MVYGTYNKLVTGAYKPTNITGGPHIVLNIPKNHGGCRAGEKKTLKTQHAFQSVTGIYWVGFMGYPLVI